MKHSTFDHYSGKPIIDAHIIKCWIHYNVYETCFSPPDSSFPCRSYGGYQECLWMKRNEGRFEKLADLPKVADSCADQAVVRKVPVYIQWCQNYFGKWLSWRNSVTYNHRPWFVCPVRFSQGRCRRGWSKMFCSLFTFLQCNSIDETNKTKSC